LEGSLKIVEERRYPDRKRRLRRRKQEGEKLLSGAETAKKETMSIQMSYKTS